MRLRKPKDEIYRILCETYCAPESKPNNWWDRRKSVETYTSELNRELTVSILEHYAAVLLTKETPNEWDYYYRTLFQETQSIIWMVYAGGTTAENCTKRIFDALGLSYD